MVFNCEWLLIYNAALIWFFGREMDIPPGRTQHATVCADEEHFRKWCLLIQHTGPAQTNTSSSASPSPTFFGKETPMYLIPKLNESITNCDFAAHKLQPIVKQDQGIRYGSGHSRKRYYFKEVPKVEAIAMYFSCGNMDEGPSGTIVARERRLSIQLSSLVYSTIETQYEHGRKYLLELLDGDEDHELFHPIAHWQWGKIKRVLSKAVSVDELISTLIVILEVAEDDYIGKYHRVG
ncbi:hypothetical protein JG687_00002591 [Phytophthora cactorum]|uniref:Uncharacterized protein n=1 Tax=Phytophthora cactorum TaxID=29920 RepID=A0A8T1UYN2_9STRA|nr:hypothetical protein GQ600_2070 [Phytophthora cactorum]KAG6970507.1 hypothetical protein JG687_00002591 [Phytophthora cactorum]